MGLQHFRYYTKEDILSLTKLRRFETKLGERVANSAGTDLAARLQSTTAQYVIFGIAENIGVKANGGVGGTSTAWLAFLKAFLNVQSNDFFFG